MSFWISLFSIQKGEVALFCGLLRSFVPLKKSAIYSVNQQRENQPAVSRESTFADSVLAFEARKCDVCGSGMELTANTDAAHIDGVTAGAD